MIKAQNSKDVKYNLKVRIARLGEDIIRFCKKIPKNTIWLSQEQVLERTILKQITQNANKILGIRQRLVIKGVQGVEHLVRMTMVAALVVTERGGNSMARSKRIEVIILTKYKNVT